MIHSYSCIKYRLKANGFARAPSIVYAQQDAVRRAQHPEHVTRHVHKRFSRRRRNLREDDSKCDGLPGEPTNAGTSGRNSGVRETDAWAARRLVVRFRIAFSVRNVVRVGPWRRFRPLPRAGRKSNRSPAHVRVRRVPWAARTCTTRVITRDGPDR